MTLSTEPLTTLLSPYPTLREVLGPDWITEQDAIDPVLSRFSLTRWLRVDGFDPDLSALDEILKELRNIPGMKERRRRMRSDPFALMETLTELHFGSWLRHRGIPFDLPKEGADFKVHLGNGRSLAIEATTPRMTHWAQDLFERLDLVGQRSGYAVDIEYELETLPDMSRSMEIVLTVVRDALEALTPTGAKPKSVTIPEIDQDYPMYGTKVIWTPSLHPGIKQWTSPKPTSPYTMFYRLVSVAQTKACQLPVDQAGVLLLGTANLPHTQLWSFEKALFGEDLEFDWTQVPNQIKHVILYTFKLERVDPFKAMCITNPASTLADTPEVTEFYEDLFPRILASNQESIPVSE